MTSRRSYSELHQLLPLDERLRKEAIDLRKQAESLHPCSRRDELLRRADQMDHAIAVNGWLNGELGQTAYPTPAREVRHRDKFIAVVSTSTAR